MTSRPAASNLGTANPPNPNLDRLILLGFMVLSFTVQSNPCDRHRRRWSSAVSHAPAVRPVRADLGRGRRRDHRAAGAAGRTRAARHRGALHRLHSAGCVIGSSPTAHRRLGSPWRTQRQTQSISGSRPRTQPESCRPHADLRRWPFLTRNSEICTASGVPSAARPRRPLPAKAPGSP